MNHVETATERDLDLVRSADEIHFDEMDDTYRLRYDPLVDDASLAVVTAVAAASNTSPDDLEPLYGAIDPEALDKLCSDGGHDRQITFQYATLEVTVEGSGTIECSPPSTGQNA